MEATQKIGDNLIKVTEDFYNETAVTILAQNYNMGVIAFAFIYFIILFIGVKFFFKNSVYTFYYHITLFLIYTSTFLIYLGKFSFALVGTILIVLISIFSQKDTFIDLLENIKLQKTETDRFSMVLLFSGSNKTDLENKMANLSVMELAKEDYTLAIEKTKRIIKKMTAENFNLIFWSLMINFLNLIFIITTYYFFVIRTEFFTQ